MKTTIQGNLKGKEVSENIKTRIKRKLKTITANKRLKKVTKKFKN